MNWQPILVDLSLNADEHMRWIYDQSHRDYNTPRAKDLRKRRENALRNAPEWMREIASRNDAQRKFWKGY